MNITRLKPILLLSLFIDWNGNEVSFFKYLSYHTLNEMNLKFK